MGIGRVASEFWTGPKRAHLERMTKGKWAPKPALGAMCAAEACARIWGWLDGLDSLTGEIPCPEAMADVAGWNHKPCLLMEVLVTAGLVDEMPNGAQRWHNWPRLNSRPISGRIHRRKGVTIGGTIPPTIPPTIPGTINAGSDSDSCSYSDPGSGSGLKSTGVAKATPRRVRAANPTDVDAVIAHYKTYHPRARPGAKERKLIAARMSEGYSPKDLANAIDGCHRSPFHSGENENSRTYQTLGLILRDSGKVQQFMEMPEPTATGKLGRNVRAGQEWLEMKRQQGARINDG